MSVRHIVDILDTSNENLLYPNPSNGIVILENANIGFHTIIDNTGNSIRTFEIEQTPHQLDISALPKGIYFIVEQNFHNFYKLIIGEK